MIIGITGGTGCGKTTLLEIIRANGGLVLDCDAVYHQLLQTDHGLLQSIEDRFPGTVTDGQLQRKVLGSIVFSDPAALEDLNRITHGAVRQAVVEQLTPEPTLAAIDAIGLFESGLDKLCKLTIAVTAPRDQRINRLMARDNITREYAQARIDAQPADEIFAQKCDFCLTNDGSADDFRQKCLVFLTEQGIIKENSKGEWI